MNFHEEVEKVRTVLNDGMAEGPPRVLVGEIEQRITGLLRCIEALSEEFSRFRTSATEDIDALRDEIHGTE